MSRLAELQKYVSDLAVLIFATAYLPRDIPNYWKEVEDFAKSGLSATEVQAIVENIQFLNQAVFASDKELLKEISTTQGGTAPTGVFLVSSKKICGACGASLHTRADRPRKLVLYTLSSGTLPATHFRKICSSARYGCKYVQHFGYHSQGTL